MVFRAPGSGFWFFHGQGRLSSI